jgi:hypothetical protein
MEYGSQPETAQNRKMMKGFTGTGVFSFSRNHEQFQCSGAGISRKLHNPAANIRLIRGPSASEPARPTIRSRSGTGTSTSSRRLKRISHLSDRLGSSPVQLPRPRPCAWIIGPLNFRSQRKSELCERPFCSRAIGGLGSRKFGSGTNSRLGPSDRDFCVRFMDQDRPIRRKGLKGGDQAISTQNSS